MAAGSTKRKHRMLSAGEINRALVASAALGAILLLAFFVTAGSYVTADRQAKNAVAKIAPLSPSTGGEAAHRVASIVVETDKKGRCEERHRNTRAQLVYRHAFIFFKDNRAVLFVRKYIRK